MTKQSSRCSPCRSLRSRSSVVVRRTIRWTASPDSACVGVNGSQLETRSTPPGGRERVFAAAHRLADEAGRPVGEDVARDDHVELSRGPVRRQRPLLDRDGGSPLVDGVAVRFVVGGIGLVPQLRRHRAQPAAMERRAQPAGVEPPEAHGRESKPRFTPGHARRLFAPAAILSRSADVAQLARASACHAEGRGFESHHPLSQ